MAYRIPLFQSFLILVSSVTPLFLNAQNEHMVNKRAVERLIKEAKRAHTDGLIVLHNGVEIARYLSELGDKPIETMSVTKSIENLAFGLLATHGTLPSLDQPLCYWWPEWRQGKKAQVTIRQLMSHTTGIHDEGDFHIEIYHSPNFVQLGLCASLLSEPGHEFSYSNKATNLLPALFEKIAHQPIDTYVKSHLFAPLGIFPVNWDHDRAGNVYGLGGLSMRAVDLAKIGQLVLQRGVWQGKQIIASSWLDLSLHPSQELNKRYGLLWWLIYDATRYIIDDAQLKALKKTKASAAFLNRVQSLQGVYTTEADFSYALERTFGTQWRRTIKQELGMAPEELAREEFGKIIGYRAEGYLGQYLVIYPEKNLVGVRLIHETDHYDANTDWFAEFPDLLYEVVT